MIHQETLIYQAELERKGSGKETLKRKCVRVKPFKKPISANRSCVSKSVLWQTYFQIADTSATRSMARELHIHTAGGEKLWLKQFVLHPVTERRPSCLKRSLCLTVCVQLTVYITVHVGRVLVCTYLVYVVRFCVCAYAGVHLVPKSFWVCISLCCQRLCVLVCVHVLLFICVCVSVDEQPLGSIMPVTAPQRESSQPDNLWKRFKAKLNPQLMNY